MNVARQWRSGAVVAHVAHGHQLTMGTILKGRDFFDLEQFPRLPIPLVHVAIVHVAISWRSDAATVSTIPTVVSRRPRLLLLAHDSTTIGLEGARGICPSIRQTELLQFRRQCSGTAAIVVEQLVGRGWSIQLQGCWSIGFLCTKTLVVVVA